MEARILGNANMTDVADTTPDLKVVNDPGAWIVVCKASSEKQGWMRSTKAMNLPNGILVNGSHTQRNPDNTHSIAESLVFIPDLKVTDDGEIVPGDLHDPDGYDTDEILPKLGDVPIGGV